jgi:predicted Zn-dependent peptidase
MCDLNNSVRTEAMKKMHILGHRWWIGILVGLCTTTVSVAQKSPKDTFVFPELNPIVVPDVQQSKLQNGMKLFLIQDPEFPTVDIRVMVKVGTIYEPREKTGLASITGRVLRAGGTETMTGKEIDAMLELLGGTVETGIGQEWGYVSVSVFKEDLEKGLTILADLLMRPAFRAEKIELAKVRERSVISRRNDQVWGIRGREFEKLIYGAESPYARYPEYSTIEAITREDIVQFYRRFFHPNNTFLAVWGDFDSKQMKEGIEKAFGAWGATPIEFPDVQEVEYHYTYTVNYIHKPDLNQSHIQMGHIGGMMSSPDYPALVIMNQILDRDRMFNTIRSREGLTYAPWGVYGADYDRPGVFSCGTQTKSQSTTYAIRLMLKEVKRMTEEEVTQEELQRAKDSYLNSFVFNFQSKESIVIRLMTYAFFGYPLDFAEQTKRGIESVTREDVLRVAGEHLRPDKLQILVVGNQGDFDEPLSVLGSVNTIDITIPAPAE